MIRKIRSWFNREPPAHYMKDIDVIGMVRHTTNPEEMAAHIKVLRDEGKITQKAYTLGMNWMKLPTEEQIQEAREYLKQLQAEEEGKE